MFTHLLPPLQNHLQTIPLSSLTSLLFQVMTTSLVLLLDVFIHLYFHHQFLSGRPDRLWCHLLLHTHLRFHLFFHLLHPTLLPFLLFNLPVPAMQVIPLLCSLLYVLPPLALLAWLCMLFSPLLKPSHILFPIAIQSFMIPETPTS